MTAALPLAPADLYQAQRRLRGVAATTPALSSPALDMVLGRSVVGKAEALQRTGSFKSAVRITPSPRSARPTARKA
jgi:threonine dehydratase